MIGKPRELTPEDVHFQADIMKSGCKVSTWYALGWREGSEFADEVYSDEWDNLFRVGKVTDCRYDMSPNLFESREEALEAMGFSGIAYILEFVMYNESFFLHKAALPRIIWLDVTQQCDVRAYQGVFGMAVDIYHHSVKIGYVGHKDVVSCHPDYKAQWYDASHIEIKQRRYV